MYCIGGILSSTYSKVKGSNIMNLSQDKNSENLWIDNSEVQDLYEADPKLAKAIVKLNRVQPDLLNMKKKTSGNSSRLRDTDERTIQIDSDSDDEEPRLVIAEEPKSMPNLDEIRSDDEIPTSSGNKNEYTLQWAPPINDPVYGYSETEPIKRQRRKNIKPVFVDSGTQYNEKDLQLFCDKCIMGENNDNDDNNEPESTLLLSMLPAIIAANIPKTDTVGLTPLNTGPSSIQMSAVQVTRRAKRPLPDLISMQKNLEKPNSSEPMDSPEYYNDYEEENIQLSSFRIGGNSLMVCMCFLYSF